MARKQPVTRPKAPGGRNRPSPNELRRLRAANARLAELKLARLRGELVEAAAVARQVTLLCDVVKAESRSLIDDIIRGAAPAVARADFLRRCAAAMDAAQQQLQTAPAPDATTEPEDAQEVAHVV